MRPGFICTATVIASISAAVIPTAVIPTAHAAPTGRRSMDTDLSPRRNALAERGVRISAAPPPGGTIVAWSADGCTISSAGTDGDMTWQQASAWIDYTIPNWSYDKDTGIVWTIDGWATSYWSDAWYESTNSDGRERWGVDLTGLVEFLYDDTARPDMVYLEYAIYYTVGSTTWWDNNSGWNHQLILKEDC